MRETALETDFAFIIAVLVGLISWGMYSSGKDVGKGSEICKPDQYYTTLDPSNTKETIVCKKADGSLYTKDLR